MKFSWKISISMLVISMLVMGLGGYALLGTLFSSSWQRETRNAAEENRMLAYSFVAYWNTTVQEWQNFTDEEIQKTAEAMSQGMTDSGLTFRIYDGDGQLLYMEKQIPYDQEKEKDIQKLIKAASGETRARELREENGTYELATMSRILLGEKRVIYLESDRDVTALFNDRTEQYRIYRRWMLVVLLLELPVCYLMTVWLLKPLRRLSRAARRIANGNMEVRAKVESDDEVGELTRDFNQMADHLEQQFTELQDTARRQEDFIGSFAHELKTPLTSMIGYADMLRSREMTEEERMDVANYIFKEGKRLEALSFKLLDLMVLRHQELAKRRVSTEWLAEEIRGILEPALEKQEICLWVSVENRQVELEPDLMKTVLMNLLDNGRKAMEGSGREKRLTLLGRPEQGGYAFYVCDKGKGMPEAELSRITEAFYMVDKSRSRKQGGAGLGLSICAEIVKRHEGRLDFQSEEGKGTLVRVWLPEQAGEEEA